MGVSMYVKKGSISKATVVLYTSLYLHKFQNLVPGTFWHFHVK
jgi:hypothetical protein